VCLPNTVAIWSILDTYSVRLYAVYTHFEVQLLFIYTNILTHTSGSITNDIWISGHIYNCSSIDMDSKHNKIMARYEMKILKL